MTNSKKTFAGIDWSMSSPAICVSKWPYDIKNCKFYYISDLKKTIGTFGNLTGTRHPIWTKQEERYSNFSLWAINILEHAEVDVVFLEGYAYAASGQVFNIGENTGLLKYHLWKYGYRVHTLAPSEIKKTATGKGNANKEKMYEAFLKETGLDLRDRLSLTEKQMNPLSDIVDSFFIIKIGIEKYFS